LKNAFLICPENGYAASENSSQISASGKLYYYENPIVHSHPGENEVFRQQN